MEINPYQLDWGKVYVDSYDVETKNATLIYNFEFNTANLYSDYISYSTGHIYWVMLNLPAGSSVTAIFDLRGLEISQQTENNIGQEIKKHLHKLIYEKLLNIVFKS
jgi:hypothetical protein